MSIEVEIKPDGVNKCIQTLQGIPRIGETVRLNLSSEGETDFTVYDVVYPCGFETTSQNCLRAKRTIVYVKKKKKVQIN